jgi:hypothetical protein
MLSLTSKVVLWVVLIKWIYRIRETLTKIKTNLDNKDRM